MPRNANNVNPMHTIPISFEQRLAAERVFLRDPLRWRSPTNVLRRAAELGMPYVRAEDVTAAHLTRRHRGATKPVGFWPETVEHARTRVGVGGAIACRIVAAIDHGLGLVALAAPA